MGNVNWVDEFLPTPEGIALKEARERLESVVTLKDGVWRFIHGHPVLIGGGGSGGKGKGPNMKKKPGMTGDVYEDPETQELVSAHATKLAGKTHAFLEGEAKKRGIDTSDMGDRRYRKSALANAIAHHKVETGT